MQWIRHDDAQVIESRQPASHSSRNENLQTQALKVEQHRAGRLENPCTRGGTLSH